MSCRIVVCENSYLPISRRTVPGELLPTDASCDDVHLHVLTYLHERHDDLPGAEKAMQAAIDGLLLKGYGTVLLATHNLVVVPPQGGAVARMAYDRSDQVLRDSLRRARTGCAIGMAGLLDWFWRNSGDLPPSGLAWLRDQLEGTGVHGNIWSQLRGDKRLATALGWLVMLDAKWAEDSDFRFVRSLLAGDKEVDHADHARALSWATKVAEPDRNLFFAYCGLVSFEASR
jgi:hypothetical protein